MDTAQSAGKGQQPETSGDLPAEHRLTVEADELFGEPLELSQDTRQVLQVGPRKVPTTVEIQPLRAVSWCSDADYLASVREVFANLEPNPQDPPADGEWPFDGEPERVRLTGNANDVERLKKLIAWYTGLAPDFSGDEVHLVLIEEVERLGGRSRGLRSGPDEYQGMLLAIRGDAVFYTADASSFPSKAPGHDGARDRMLAGNQRYWFRAVESINPWIGRAYALQAGPADAATTLPTAHYPSYNLFPDGDPLGLSNIMIHGGNVDMHGWNGSLGSLVVPLSNWHEWQDQHWQEEQQGWLWLIHPGATARGEQGPISEPTGHGGPPAGKGSAPAGKGEDSGQSHTADPQQPIGCVPPPRACPECDETVFDPTAEHCPACNASMSGEDDEAGKGNDETEELSPVERRLEPIRESLRVHVNGEPASAETELEGDTLEVSFEAPAGNHPVSITRVLQEAFGPVVETYFRDRVEVVD